jgi:hypothetical protein
VPAVECSELHRAERRQDMESQQLRIRAVRPRLERRPDVFKPACRVPGYRDIGILNRRRSAHHEAVLVVTTEEVVRVLVRRPWIGGLEIARSMLLGATDFRTSRKALT